MRAYQCSSAIAKGGVWDPKREVLKWQTAEITQSGVCQELSWASLTPAKGHGWFDRPVVSEDGNSIRYGRISLDERTQRGASGKGAAGHQPLEGVHGVCRVRGRCPPREGRETLGLRPLRRWNAVIERLVRSLLNHGLTFQEQPFSCTLNFVVSYLETCVPASAAAFSLSKPIAKL